MSDAFCPPNLAVEFGNEARYDAAAISRGTEWYVTFLLCMLMLEGVLNPFVDSLVSNPVWQAIFSGATGGFNFRPSEALLYFIALPVGLVLMLAARREWHRPTPGKWILAGVWVVYFGWALLGSLRGNPVVLGDIRTLVLPSLVVPWLVVLGKNIRYEVVFARVIRFAIPLALVNLVFAVTFFRGDVRAAGEEAIFPNLRRDLPLLLPYFLAFARTITSDRRTRPAILALIILAMGIVAGLSKPTLVTFVLGNILLMGVISLARRGLGPWALFKLVGAGLLVSVVLTGLLLVVFRLGEGSAESWLRRVVLKEGLPEQDLSGGRLEMWEYCLGQWAKQPVMGTGLGGGKMMVRHKETGGVRPLAVHNLPFQTLMQTGLAGMSLFVICVTAFVARYLKTLRKEVDPVRFWPRLGLGVYAMSILMATLYGDALSAGPAGALFWMAIALDAASQSSLGAPADRAA